MPENVYSIIKLKNIFFMKFYEFMKFMKFLMKFLFFSYLYSPDFLQLSCITFIV